MADNLWYEYWFDLGDSQRLSAGVFSGATQAECDKRFLKHHATMLKRMETNTIQWRSKLKVDKTKRINNL